MLARKRRTWRVGDDGEQVHAPLALGTFEGVDGEGAPEQLRPRAVGRAGRALDRSIVAVSGSVLVWAGRGLMRERSWLAEASTPAYLIPHLALTARTLAGRRAPESQCVSGYKRRRRSRSESVRGKKRGVSDL